MFKERKEKMKIAMRQNQANNLIITDPDSIYYYTGYKTDPGERFLALLAQTEGPFTLFLNRLFPPADKFADYNTIYYNDGEDIISTLAGMISSNVIWVDKFIAGHFLIDLMDELNRPKVKNGSLIVDELRGVKSPQERQIMAQASAKNDQVMEYAFSILSQGLSEQELARRIENRYLETGHTGVSFPPIVAYGANGADPHHVSGHSLPKIGDSIILDIGGIYKDYASDMTRTVFYGQASDKAKEIYEIVRAANQAGIRAVKPGVRFCDIDKAARKVITDAGYGEFFTHRTGHFIGLNVHEHGDVGPFNQAKCQVGQTFSIEPGIYLPGEFGVRIEDIVLVTEDGCQVLNNVSRDLKIIEV